MYTEVRYELGYVTRVQYRQKPLKKLSDLKFTIHR